MTPILGKPCSYDSASHNQSAEVDDWRQSSGPGLFDFEDRESMDSLQLLARASKTNGRRKMKVTQRAKYNLLKGGFVNCLTKKSSKRMPFDVRTTQELRDGARVLSLQRSVEFGLLQDVVPDLEWFDHETVYRNTCHTSHLNTYSHCTACSHCTVTFITRHAWLMVIGWCPIKTLHHLARHVSCFDARYTQHLHSVLAFLSYPGTSTGGHILDPLRRSTTSS